MPLYSFGCPACRTDREVLRSVDARHFPLMCECGAFMKRQVESFKIDTFTPYYDEGLGCNVWSKSDKKRIMRSLGVIETGDKVRGGRNFDKHAPEHMKPLPVQPELPAQTQEHVDQIVQVVSDAGLVQDRVRMSALPVV